jgi:hypothetical protein
MNLDQRQFWQLRSLTGVLGNAAGKVKALEEPEIRIRLPLQKCTQVHIMYLFL